jgi:hypothetical protein
MLKMKKDNFDKWDEKLEKKFKELPKKEISPILLNQLGDAIADKLSERQLAKAPRSMQWIPIGIPAFAVCLLAFVVIVRMPVSPTFPIQKAPIQLASNTQDIDEEIAALRELGVWTEDDEKEIGIS